MRKTPLIVFWALLIGWTGCQDVGQTPSQPSVSAKSLESRPIFEIGLDLMESGAHFPEVDSHAYPHLRLPPRPMEPIRKVAVFSMSPQISLLIIQEFFEEYHPKNPIPIASGVKFYCLTVNEGGEFIDQFPIAFMATEKQGESWMESRLMPDYSLLVRGKDSPDSPILSPNRWVAYSKITENGKFEMASDYIELVDSLAIASQNNE